METPTQPIKYSSTFKAGIDQYIIDCQKNKQTPSVLGFAKLIGTDEKTMWIWANKKKKDEQGKEINELVRPNFLSRVNKLKQLSEVKIKEKKEEKLTPKQELFCRYYTQNSVLFGNATLSYAEAYGYDLEVLDRTYLKDNKGKDIKGTSEYDKACNLCAVDGSRLLRNAKINEFMRVCLNELLSDLVVDSELAKVIVQNDEMDVKISGIREYNKLKKRVTDKMDIVSDGKQIVSFNFIVPKEKDGTDNSNNQTNS